MRAWLMFTKDTGGDVDQTGYGDRLGVRYGYDTDVPNHKQVGVGDVLVLRNASGSLGVGFISDIRSRHVEAEIRRCPTCNSKELTSNTTCVNGHGFTEARLSLESMTEFAAEYAGSFVATTAVPLERLEALCVARAIRNAMRELHLDALMTLLRDHGIVPGFRQA